MNKVSKRLHRPDHGGNAAVAFNLQFKDIADSIVGCPAELSQQFPVVPEIYTQTLGNREHPLTVRYLGKHFVLEPVGEQQRPLLVARRTA